MLIDLHIHTGNVSVCARTSADEIIRIYKEKTSYDAVVITDHINQDFIKAVENYQNEDWQDTVSRHMAGYKLAKQEGDRLGIKVFYGCELKFDSNSSDYLVYGMSEEFLRNHPHINRLTVKEFSSLARENNILFYQAHPFRDGMTVTNPELLFGIEAGNGHSNHNSRNSFAHLWADCYNLHKIAGSDYHAVGDEGRGGIITNRSIESYDDLLDVLRENDYLIAQTVNCIK